MDKHLDMKMAMRVFHKVREEGEKTEEGHQLDGLTAIASFDGYTLTLKDRDVTLIVFFHNKYDMQFEHAGDADHFIKLLERIDGGDN